MQLPVISAALLTGLLSAFAHGNVFEPVAGFEPTGLDKPVIIEDIRNLTTGAGSEIAARQAAGQVRACWDINWVGCENWATSLNTCYNLWGHWDGQISSMRTGPNMWCYIFEDHNCQGTRGGPITNDNRHNDLRAYTWNDRTSSFICYA
ncbi:hypothetical protein QBC44DRAFT_367993 [Cladorrhinum sp. PSN332]|nr:hypothetical protein QBC44DRAFT_367993 [Cladorrhinum sp. PSN332]